MQSGSQMSRKRVQNISIITKRKIMNNTYLDVKEERREKIEL